MKKKLLFVGLVILVLGGGIYANTLDVRFLFDDLPVIVENSLFHQTPHIKSLFRYDPTRFLTHLSFALNIQAHGLHEKGFHVINILLHCINALLVYYLLTLTFDLAVGHRPKMLSSHMMAFFGALIFLMHPIQTQAVTYIVQRSVLLAAFFYLTTLIVYIRLRLNFSWVLYSLAWGMVIGGCMTKPIFVTVPLSILLYEHFFLRGHCGKIKNIWIFVFPFCLPVFIIPLFLMSFMLRYFGESFDVSKFVYATAATSEISRGEYLLTQFNVIITYLRLLFWPAGQNVDYDFSLSTSLFHWPTFFSFILLLVLLGTAVYLQRKKHHLMSFSIIWFFVLLIPESSIFPLPDVIFEHRLYLGVISFAVCVVLLFQYVTVVHRHYTVMVSIAIATFCLLTFSRNLIWTDPVMIIKDSISKSPLKARPRIQLGYLYEKRGWFHLAEKEYTGAIKLDRQSATAYNKLGALYGQVKRYEDARMQFEKILRMNPHHFDGNLNLGIVYYRSGQFDLARKQFFKAIDLKPKDHRPYHSMARLLNTVQGYDEAERYYLLALERNPYGLDLYYELGNVYLMQKQYDTAIVRYRRALALNPNYADAHNTLGIAYVNISQEKKALKHFLRALALKPHDKKIYMNLSGYYYNLGNHEKSQYYREQAQRLP